MNKLIESLILSKEPASLAVIYSLAEAYEHFIKSGYSEEKAISALIDYCDDISYFAKSAKYNLMAINKDK